MSRPVQSHLDLLRTLVECQTPLADIASRLSAFSWDSPPLLVLRREHVVAVLRRYLAGELRAEDVHEWADLVEVRDDIGLELGHEVALRNALFALATPEVEGQLDSTEARKLIQLLEPPDLGGPA